MADIWSKYIEILTDPAHTFVEFTFVLFVDVLLLGVVWPLIKRHIHRDIASAHQARDAQHGHKHWDAEDVTWADWIQANQDRDTRHGHGHQTVSAEELQHWEQLDEEEDYKDGASAYVVWDTLDHDWEQAYQGENGERL